MTFEVSGTVEGTEDELAVHVGLRNGGDTPATSLDVEGELLGGKARESVPEGVAAGASRGVVLKFPVGAVRPGVHPLTLLLDYTVAGAQGPSAVSQRAYLLLGLGGVADPAVRLSLRDAPMDFSGQVDVDVESADGAPHTALVRLLGPRGFRADSPADEVRVPAHGSVRVPIRVFRGALPWGSRQGVLAVAEATDGPLASAAVATAAVEIAPDPAWMPRVRKPVLLLTVVLVCAAACLEAWRRQA